MVAVMCALVNVTTAQEEISFDLVRVNIQPLGFPDIGFGDLDRDGQLDILISGQRISDFPHPVTRGYVGVFEGLRVPAGGGDPRLVRDFDAYSMRIDPTWLGNVRFFDASNNGRLDALVTGLSGASETTTGIYHFSNLQFGTYDADLVGLIGGSSDNGDFNNDGNEDILLTGSSVDGEYQATLLEGAGRGSFVETRIELPGIGMGDGRFVDVDGDADLDVFLVGDTQAGPQSFLFLNTGGEFVPVQTDISGLVFASTDWGDFDNDGDPDLVISGAIPGGQLMEPFTLMYRNEGDYRFTKLAEDLEGSYYGTVRWADFDDDGALDLMVVGGGLVDKKRVGTVYRNLSHGFLKKVNLLAIGTSSSDVADYDGDGDLDIIQAGEGRVALFRNSRYFAPDHDQPRDVPFGQPSPPSNLAAQVDGTSVNLTWDPGSDNQTPEQGLTYNIRIGTAPLAVDVMPSTSNPSTGRRLVSRPGNVRNNLNWTIHSLAPGQYFWSVQTIDSSFNWSAFAEEERFVVN